MTQTQNPTSQSVDETDEDVAATVTGPGSGFTVTGPTAAPDPDAKASGDGDGDESEVDRLKEENARLKENLDAALEGVRVAFDQGVEVGLKSKRGRPYVNPYEWHEDENAEINLTT